MPHDRRKKKSVAEQAAEIRRKRSGSPVTHDPSHPAVQAPERPEFGGPSAIPEGILPPSNLAGTLGVFNSAASLDGGLQKRFDQDLANANYVNKTTGKQLKYAGKVWGRMRTEAGLPWLRIHDLRHSAASFMIASGRTLFEVQQVLGHSTPVMTQRYAHIAPQALLDSANTTSVILERAMAANEE